MKEYTLIKIGTIYLTDNRLIGGEKYWAHAEGFEKLLSTSSVRHQITSGLGVYSQYNEVGHAGKQITIVAEFPKFDLAEDVIDLLKTANQNKTTINVSFKLGNKINYIGTAKPMDPIASW